MIRRIRQAPRRQLLNLNLNLNLNTNPERGTRNVEPVTGTRPQELQ
jgi:hypothetical protein